MKKNLLHVVGARPNFMKAAPVVQAFSRHDGVLQTLVHTGQHYDISMSDVFFQELSLPKLDVNLGVGTGSHAQQTADIIRLWLLSSVLTEVGMALSAGLKSV